ncbi:MAG: hypothetical protein IJ491_09160 [Clostridia bacterium]|nr:hypothetical protein [Clostridia bacterium]
MQIFLKNESDKIININLCGQNFTLIPLEGKYAQLPEGEATMLLSTDEEYSSEPITKKAGLSYFHRFVTESGYKFTVGESVTIQFYSETAHGNNFESYQRVYPFCVNLKFSEPVYTVKGADKIKENIIKTEKREAVLLQGAGVAGKLIKAKNTFDDIIAGLICGLIAIVIFVLIWIFKDFKTAATVYLIVAGAALLLWKLFIERAVKKLKNKAKAKAEQKFEKAFLPCADMPGDLFKGKNSYFDTEYISAVFRNSTKRK